MLHDKMKKLMAKKDKEDMSENEIKAKKSALEDLLGEAHNAMVDKMDGLKKVSIASNSKQGLQEGLDKAKELLDAKEEPMEEEAFEGEESPEEEMAEEKEAEEAMTPEEIEEKIKALLALKAKKMNPGE